MRQPAHTLENAMPTIAFTVNEVHSSRQNVELSAEEFRTYARLPTDEARAQFIQGLRRGWVMEDNSLEFSHYLEDTMRDLDVIDDGGIES